jgi:putative oxidoreductase
MERFSRYGILIARVMISLVFLLNALGVIDQDIPAREMMERGAPSALVPVMMLAGRSVELVAGVALIPGVFPRLALSRSIYRNGAVLTTAWQAQP